MPLPSEKFFPVPADKARPAKSPEKTVLRSLKEFVSDVRDAAHFAADFCAELSRLPLAQNLDGNQLFEVEAARRGELKDHIALRRLRQADRSIGLRESTLELSREKFHFDAAEIVLKQFAEIKHIHDNGALPHPEKIAALRQILFAALPTPDEDTDPASSPEEDPAFS